MGELRSTPDCPALLSGRRYKKTAITDLVLHSSLTGSVVPHALVYEGGFISKADAQTMQYHIIVSLAAFYWYDASKILKQAQGYGNGQDRKATTESKVEAHCELAKASVRSMRGRF